jgi:hypothetical protein
MTSIYRRPAGQHSFERTAEVNMRPMGIGGSKARGCAIFEGLRC